MYMYIMQTLIMSQINHVTRMQFTSVTSRDVLAPHHVFLPAGGMAIDPDEIAVGAIHTTASTTRPFVA